MALTREGSPFCQHALYPARVHGVSATLVRMARRTGEQTRELLIRTGVQMLLERGVSAGVQHIRLQDVLRRAGLTTGAAYRLWADQTDFQRDLAVTMVRMRVEPATQHVFDAVRALVDDGAAGDDVIRAAAQAHLETMGRTDDGEQTLDSQSFLIALALRATADTWPQLRQASLDRHEESATAFTNFYRQLMAAYHVRMREPLTVEDFSAAMAALGEGFAIHSLEGIAHPTFDFTDADEAPTGRWTLFALGVRALVNEFMVTDDGEVPTRRG